MLPLLRQERESLGVVAGGFRDCWCLVLSSLFFCSALSDERWVVTKETSKFLVAGKRGYYGVEAWCANIRADYDAV